MLTGFVGLYRVFQLKIFDANVRALFISVFRWAKSQEQTPFSEFRLTKKIAWLNELLIAKTIDFFKTQSFYFFHADMI